MTVSSSCCCAPNPLGAESRLVTEALIEVSGVRKSWVTESSRADFSASLRREISADAAEWEKLLAPTPQPFYQDVFGAALHHPVSLGGDFETLYAYYPAIRRVIELLREARG